MDKEINIMHLLPSLATGGAEMLLLDTVPRLNYEGFNSCICTFFEQGSHYEIAEKKGIKLFSIGARHNVLSQLNGIIKLQKITKRENITLIHIHLMYKHIVLLRLIKNIPKIIVSLHNNKVHHNFILKKYDGIITCGEEIYRNVSNKIKNKPVYLLPNSIDINRVVSNERKNFILNKKSLPTNKTIILLVGRLSKVKRINFALDALKYAIDRGNTDLMLLVVGTGKEINTLNKMIIENKLENNARLLNKVSDIASYYRIADIYLNTSLYEGLPLTILEAMANKIPVIASRVPGNRELYNGDNMVLYEHDNIQKLVYRILELHKDKKKRDDIGKAGFDFFNKKYNIDKYISSIKDIYTNMHTTFNRN